MTRVAVHGRKIWAWAVGLVFLLAALVFASACDSSGPRADTGLSDTAKRVLIVHSYSNAFQWTQELDDGIIEGLRRMGYTGGREYELKTFFMDTKVTHTTPEQVKKRAAEALAIIREYHPDILFVTDDNALREVGVTYAEENPDAAAPTVFSGINVDPSSYKPIENLDMPGGLITGALERIPYREAFQLGKRLFPDASKIVILADASGSSSFVTGTFHQDYPDSVEGRPLEVLDFAQPETFQEWKETVLEYQKKADIIGILNYHQLKDEDGNIVAAQEAVDWMADNNRLPEIGLVSEWAEDGILMSAGNSGYKTGIYVGFLGGRILDGQDPGTISIVDPKEIDAKYNLRRARMLGIVFPPGELVAAAEVFNTMGGTE